MPLTLPHKVTMVMAEDGAVRAAGLNDAGQLGDGSATNRKSFVRVVGPTGVRVCVRACVSALYEVMVLVNVALKEDCLRCVVLVSGCCCCCVHMRACVRKWTCVCVKWEDTHTLFPILTSPLPKQPHTHLA